MADDKDPREAQPGEKEPGKFHYNPGNMSGKPIGTPEAETEDEAKAEGREKVHERRDQPG